MAFTLEYIIGDTQEVYQSFIDSLPPGNMNLTRGIVVPTHTERQPLSFLISGVSPEIVHAIQVTNEGFQSPKPIAYFVPKSDTYVLTLILNAGTNFLQVVDALGNQSQFFISVVNYAVFFQTYAQQINDYSALPIQTLTTELISPIAYRMASPVLATVSPYIPSDLETLAALSNKLLIKNFLNRPGTDAAVREIISSFCISQPIYLQMKNSNLLDAPLYRSEETFAGYEAHVWIPNREVERWLTFIQLINNLPQLYQILTINEQIIEINQGGKYREHFFDFESPFANSVIEEAAAEECFKNLFTLAMLVEGEHTIDFCQASYFLDSRITGLLTPDADPVILRDWATFTLTGRFEQQFDISPNSHKWHWDSPVVGIIDGINKYFSLSAVPSTSRAVKLFIDGLLQKFGYDFRISAGTNLRSGTYNLIYATSPIEVDIDVGATRPFLAPYFSDLEVVGGADLQLFINGSGQTVNGLQFILSDPPALTPGVPQEVKLHYATPAIPQNPGVTQYGQIPLTAGLSSYSLIFPTPTASIDYQLFVEISEDSGLTPETISQITHIVRAHTLLGAQIEFSESIPATGLYTLNWWLVEDITGISLERGSLTLTAGETEYETFWTGGPYVGQDLVVICQLWTTSAFGSVSELLVSFKNLSFAGTKFLFSEAIPDGTYRLDYLICNTQAGNFLEILQAPRSSQLVEAHFDSTYPYWVQDNLTPVPDGITTEFTLPTPCPDSQSMVLALNGRVMTQGAGASQYVLETPTKIKFNFAPTPNQIPWVIYPYGDIPSVWSQGYLSRVPGSTGANATGSITCPLTGVVPGTSISFDYLNTILSGIDTSEGTVFNPQKIRFGDSLTFTSPKRTILSINPDPANTISFPNMVNGTKLIFSSTGSLPSGITLGTQYYAINATATEFQITLVPPTDPPTPQPPVIINSTGTGAQYFRVNITLTAVGQTQGQILPYYQFAVNVDRDTDGLSLAAAINAHPVLKTLFYATYKGDGITRVKALDLMGLAPVAFAEEGVSPFSNTIATLHEHGLTDGMVVAFSSSGTLPSGLFPFTTYYIIDATPFTFKVSETLNGTAVNIIDAGSGIHSVERTDYSSNYLLTVTPLASIQASGMTGDTPPNINYFPCGVSPTLDALALSVAISTHPLLGMHYTSFIAAALVFTPLAVGIANNTITIPSHGFTDGEKIVFSTSGVLPAGIAPYNEYYVVNSATATFQISLTFGGSPIALTDIGVGTHYVSRVDLSLCISLSAKFIGPHENTTISILDPDFTIRDLTGGRNPTGDDATQFLTPKLIYYYLAPVVTLDGVSTRLYDEYGGNVVKFDCIPAPVQEPYIITETYPIDYHPLDSMVANQPECNYKKGVFVQGLQNSMGEQDIDVVTDNDLIATTDGLPVQEAPYGVINGVNTTYDMTGLSCSGQDSMMFWIDGIFQPPTTYTYLSMGTYGRIITSSPPTKNVWVWYLANGDQCGGERVYELVGPKNGINQVFTLPEAPVTDNQAILLFLQGLYNRQNNDYIVRPDLSSIEYLGALAPQSEQSIYSHYNLGLVPTLRWRQVNLFPSVGDGTNVTFTIPHTLLSELPVSVSSVLVFQNGLCQQNGTPYRSFEASAVDFINDIFTVQSHNLANGTVVALNSSGVLPTGLTPYQPYYIVNAATNTFQLSLTSGGSPVDMSDSGIGIHYLAIVAKTNFVVGVGSNGIPNGTITFILPPEAGRVLETAYLRRG